MSSSEPPSSPASAPRVHSPDAPDRGAGGSAALPPLPPPEAPAPARRPMDAGVVVAVAWLGVALGLTLVLGPRLGLRGWIWLGLHHALCLLGCSHELLRGWRRRQAG